LLSRSKTDAELDQALHLLPAERRLEIVMLARKLRQGGVSLERIVLDPQRIGMFGRALHWRIVGEYLVLAPLPDLADRYATNLAAKKVVPELAQQAKKVNLDGPFLAWINLGAPLAASDPTNEHLASWLAARHPRLTVGSNVTDERIEFQARLPLDLGLHRTELNISFWWRGGVYVLRVLGWLLLAFCLYVVVKAIRHWMAPKQ
jgi:hypothetical protein